ncbi:MAG: isochorismatase family protein [Candidatus Heimdallarchaeota archaeon]|nr:isochorismatase family protein [Candidatus Heimdallarchaeota archaeon]MCK4954616.1 isochorismatase family protein [Candidatus Heimdallarchaeota archaeon]
MEKVHYLTLSNRKEKIDEWLSISRESKSYQPFKFDINKAALLVLDMQDFFVKHDSHANVPSIESIIPTINNLISFMKDRRRPIIYTKHITSENPEDLMKKWWKDVISSDDEQSEISQKIDSGKGIIISKDSYSAFNNTDLKRILGKLSVEQVIITGVMTHLCCETTARDALMNGFEVFFVVDGTATFNEELHIGTIRAISHGFGICLSSEEIIGEE